MPLFRASGVHAGAKAQPQRRCQKVRRGTGSCCVTQDDDRVSSLRHLCLLSLADNMKEVWVKDYTDNYLDHYSFRYIMGPFNLLRESMRAYLTHEWLLTNTFAPTLFLLVCAEESFYLRHKSFMIILLQPAL